MTGIMQKNRIETISVACEANWQMDCNVIE